MECELRQSGLVVPMQKQEPKPIVHRSPMEVTGEQRRKATRDALIALWKAMGLERCGGIQLQGDDCLEPQRDLWYYFGDTVLGTDRPDMEILT